MTTNDSELRVIFLDRDGTIIVEPPDEQVDSLEKLELIPGVIHGLKSLQDAGYTLVMVTNQDNLGSKRYPMKAFAQVQKKLLRIFAGEGIRFAQVFVCPHGTQDRCACRKPKTGLVDEFIRNVNVNLQKSFVVGDRETDVKFGRNLGSKTIRITKSKSSTEADIAVKSVAEACFSILRSQRTAHIDRATKETNITGRLTLDGTGRYEVSTGIGFFDHMLEQVVRHSMMDMTLAVRGDLRVDEHHTIEDAGLAIGEAIRSALGDKRGIGRYGFVVPMDESEARVSIDLSGRPYLSFKASFARERLGDMPTELVEDFFRALSDGLRATIHIAVDGRNDHHKVEAIFKCTARALRQDVQVDFQ
ncbi:MAG: bifunctional histidinol-phosphatase/imidazoleglycerol-phosphate dehydratase HisB [Ignavibacteriales bacterium]|nr:bifunctional histidinol-phosphatase/imidazoleglycerol-phosphate dehydratase HisB [Ignavibacteriales bacterium]